MASYGTPQRETDMTSKRETVIFNPGPFLCESHPSRMFFCFRENRGRSGGLDQDFPDEDDSDRE